MSPRWQSMVSLTPTYEVKAKLSGTTFDFDVLSDVITDVEGGGITTCETDLIQSVARVSSTSDGTTVYVMDRQSLMVCRRYYYWNSKLHRLWITPETPVVNLEITIHPDVT